jgi:hypothetical protein
MYSADRGRVLSPRPFCRAALAEVLAEADLERLTEA